jgi:hypothetical protein
MLAPTKETLEVIQGHPEAQKYFDDMPDKFSDVFKARATCREFKLHYDTEKVNAS